MALIKASDARAEVKQLERRLAHIEVQLETLNRERAEAQKQLELARRALTICPKCGRDEDFLTDEGGVLIHVLEDPQDTDLLTPDKPLFCPTCGEVFLYQPARLEATPLAPTATRARLRQR